MFFKKRGQAALEFLMTYAWAILVVIIIIGALAYFGVFNVDTLLPDKCQFEGGLSCKEALYTYNSNSNTANITLRIINGLGQAVEIHSLNFSSSQIQGGDDLTACGVVYTTPVIIENGYTKQISVDAAGCYPLDTGRKVRLKGLIKYKYAEKGSLLKPSEGELFTRPVPQ